MAAPASKRCRTENIIDVEQEELSFSVELMNLKIPHFTQLYKIPNRIDDISFSSTSPDVLYILTFDGAIHSLNITTLAVTKIIKLQSVRGLLCHNDILYITTSAAIYKYTTDGECLTFINNDGYWWFGAVGKDDKLYYISINRRSIGVIDSDTMTLISTLSLCHDAYCIAVSQDNKLHVATDNGVHTYRADGSYTGMVYLEGERCRFIACVTPGVICDCLLRQPIDTQYNIYTKNSTNNSHQLEHSSNVPSKVLQIQHTQEEREATVFHCPLYIQA